MLTRNELRFLLKMLSNSSQRKHTIRWLESLQKDYLLRSCQPWLAFDAIDILSSLPLNGQRIFEYGSGGSTLFWLKHGALLTSIEHDKAWYDLLQQQYIGKASVDYRLVPPEFISSDNVNPSVPDGYGSGDKQFAQCTFRSYASQIDEFPDEFFDLVLVDGRARPSCIKHAHNKVKIGGILVLDNSDRKYYLERTSTYLNTSERRTCLGATPGLAWLTETSIFTKRKG
jgi:hypothetical protein